jgi:hypothetical protein
MTLDEDQAMTLRPIPLCTAVRELCGAAGPGHGLERDARVVAEITAAGFSGERFTASMTGAAWRGLVHQRC